jgi:hypothetical protein
MAHKHHGTAARRQSACAHTRRREPKNVYSRMISRHSTLRQRSRAACALGPASVRSLRRPSGRSGVCLHTRHLRTAAVLGQTNEDTRWIEPHHGPRSWHRNTCKIHRQWGEAALCTDIHMHKTRQFHLGGRERNGRVLGGDD